MKKNMESVEIVRDNVNRIHTYLELQKRPGSNSAKLQQEILKKIKENDKVFMAALAVLNKETFSNVILFPLVGFDLPELNYRKVTGKYLLALKNLAS